MRSAHVHMHTFVECTYLQATGRYLVVVEEEGSRVLVLVRLFLRYRVGGVWV